MSAIWAFMSRSFLKVALITRPYALIVTSVSSCTCITLICGKRAHIAIILHLYWAYLALKIGKCAHTTLILCSYSAHITETRPHCICTQIVLTTHPNSAQFHQMRSYIAHIEIILLNATILRPHCDHIATTLRPHFDHIALISTKRVHNGTIMIAIWSQYEWVQYMRYINVLCVRWARHECEYSAILSQYECAT